MSINRKSIRETTGDKNNVAQSFKHNIFFDAGSVTTVPFTFEVPQYTTIGGTQDYYGQNPLAIFTNLVKPFIRFDFSANTASFGPNVKIKHDIYRIDWDVFNASSKKPKVDSDEDFQAEKIRTETIEEVDGITGEMKKRTITTKTSEEENLVKLKKDPFKLERNIKGPNELTREGQSGDSIQAKRDMAISSILQEQEKMVADIAANGSSPSGNMHAEFMSTIQKQLLEPILSITADTTGITTSIYDLQLDQYSKNFGDYKTELFKDRSQYIIDTNFIFDRDVTAGLQDYKIVDETPGGGTQLRDSVYSNKVRTQTYSDIEQIANGDYAGLSFITGEYFSYFQVPNKPIFEYPTPSGQIDTFTPEIFWTNGEDADSYMVQVNYNTGDTGFTGTVFTYIVPKTDEFREEARSKTKDTTSEFETTKAIRKYQLSLKSNKCLLFRVGNVKEMQNIFGVRQSVVTFSENRSICTQAEPIITYVYTENDSPYVSDISGLQKPPSLENESPLEEFVLSGTVSGSTVTGATMQLIYPNASFVTTPTDSQGGFEFTELEAGVYTLNTTYRGYAMDSRVINITSDTDVFIQLKILWGNDYDTWADKGSDIIKY